MKIQLHTLPFDVAGTHFTPIGPVTYLERDEIEALTELKDQGLWVICMPSAALYAISTEEVVKYDLLNTQAGLPMKPTRPSSDPF